MLKKFLYNKTDVDPTGYDAQLEYIMENAMGSESYQDQEFMNEDEGTILQDRGQDKSFRLYVENGTLNIEEVN